MSLKDLFTELSGDSLSRFMQFLLLRFTPDTEVRVSD